MHTVHLLSPSPPPLNMCIFSSFPSSLFLPQYNRSRSLTQTLMTDSPLPQKGSNAITRSDRHEGKQNLILGTRVERLISACSWFKWWQIKTSYWPIKFRRHLATRFGRYLFDRASRVRLLWILEKGESVGARLMTHHILTEMQNGSLWSCWENNTRDYS